MLCYSIWTVDLAYLLRRSGLSVELMTITLGANPDYASEGFYKEHIQEDGSRVERLFRVSRDGAPCMQSLLRGLCITGFGLQPVFIFLRWFWVFATSRSAGRQVSQLWCLCAGCKCGWDQGDAQEHGLQRIEGQDAAGQHLGDCSGG